MDVTIQNFLKNAAASTARALLFLIGGWLIKKGVATDAEWGVAVKSAEPVLAGLFISGITLAWAYWQKWHSNQKIDAALVAPSSTTREEFEKGKVE